MTNSAREKRAQGELNMNTAVLPALAIPSSQKHQPMKTSLQKRSLRTTGLALAIALGLGLGLAVDNATAAISAITNPTNNNQMFLEFDGTNLIVPNNVGYALAMFFDEGNFLLSLAVNNSSYNADGFTQGVVSAGTVISSSLTYNDNYNSQSLPNTQYYGFAYGTGSGSSIQYHYGWVNLTVSGSGSSETLTLNSAAINTAAGESILAGQTTATAVPEPGTFLPAALLVAGAFLRRRRPCVTLGISRFSQNRPFRPLRH
jgi:MYXO-CTERM domain-containing protein